MFLASMGRLKHKRTRNTIAAEPTPRSSCPSEADQTPEPPGHARPKPQAMIQTSSVERNPVARNNSDATPTRISPNAKGLDNSSSKSCPRSPTSAASVLVNNSDHNGRRKPTGGEHMAAAKPPPAGKCEKEGRESFANDTSSPPRRASERESFSRNHRQLDPHRRPRSAGPGGRHRPPSPGVRVTRGPHPGAPKGSSTTRREVLPVTPVRDVPLNVGPEIYPATHRKGLGLHEAGPGAYFSSVARPRPRPATADSYRQEGTAWRSPRPGLHRGVNRKLGDGGGGGGRGGCGGRGGGRGRGDGRAICQTEGRRVDPTPKARVAAGGGDHVSLNEEGSFAASVVRSAQSLAEYGKDDANNDRRQMGTPRRGREGRPRSANAAVRGATKAVALDPQFSAANALAAEAETRFMPVKTIGKAFHGHRLAGVQAWDPHTAAAVRAARADTFLRRNIVDREKEGPMAAPDRARRMAAAAGIGGSKSDVSTVQHGGHGDQHRSVPAGTQQGWGEGGGGPVDWCGTIGLRKDCRT